MHISRRSLALLACAILALQTVSAMQDRDHDHDHDHDPSTTTWSCSAKCDKSVAADKICGGKNVSTASTWALARAETKKAPTSPSNHLGAHGPVRPQLLRDVHRGG